MFTESKRAMELAAASSRDRSSVARVKRQTRSRITNGTAIHLVAVDGRSAAARRFRDVLAQITADISPDGAGSLTEAQRQLARRCAMLSVECEKIEARGVAGEPIDISHYGALVDRLGRCFARLGLKGHAAKDAGPTLTDLLREDREAQMRGEDSHED
jgi:hypothetical protein